MVTLYERDDALATLAAVLASARTQAHGQIVTISGETGVGKTSLLEAFADRVGVDHDAPFLWAACEAIDTARPFGPLLDIAADLDADGLIASLLAGAPMRYQVFAAFVSALATQPRPVVIVFEDVQWADEATLDLLRYVSRRMHRLRSLIVITWRSDDVGADHPVHRLLGELPASATHRIALPSLSLDAVTHLTGDPEDARRLHVLTGGNPFFVTEVLRDRAARRRADGDGAAVAESLATNPACSAAARDGFARGVAAADASENLGDIVPASVRGAVLARRAGLPAEARQALDLVSVMPARAEIELVRACVTTLSCESARTATDVLMSAVQAGLLTFDGRTLGFRHELARLAVLASLPLLRLQELHRLVLAALVASVADADRADRADLLARLLHHAVGAGDGDAVRRFALAAARDAAALGDHRQAVAHARTALAWADDLDVAARAEIVDLLAYECCLTGDPSGRALQEESLMLALARDLPEPAARAFATLASCGLHARDYAYTRRWIDAGINHSLAHALEPARLELLACRARLLFETGKWPEAEADATNVLADASAMPTARVTALTTIGLLHARQRKPDAGRLLDRALDGALALVPSCGDAARLVAVRAARAELAVLQDRPDTARDEADAGLARLAPSEPFWERELLRYLRWRAVNGWRAPQPGFQTLDPVRGPHSLQLRGDWRAAAEAWARVGCPYARAEALADGDVAAQEEALQIFQSLGATPAADRLRRDLRRVGVNRPRRGPRRSTTAHPAGLTRRESEILGLMARDLTNPAIGERLFVSPKTVEHHVSAILGKLAVATRAEAVVKARHCGWIADRRR